MIDETWKLFLNKEINSKVFNPILNLIYEYKELCDSKLSVTKNLNLVDGHATPKLNSV